MVRMETNPSAHRTFCMDWVARIAVGLVFAMNMECAISYIVNPGGYAAAFELSGVAGEAAIRGLGIAFVMWNATYPLVIARPSTHMTLFRVVLAQQLIGLIGETTILLTLPAGHEQLVSSILRFVVFDAAGLVVMAVAFALVRRACASRSSEDA